MMSFEKYAAALASAFNVVAGVAVVAMMLLTCTDVVLRFFRHPVPGTYELVGLLGGIAVAFSMAHTTATRGHVAVSLIVRRFSKRTQNALDAVTSLLGCALFSVASWQLLVMGRDFKHSGQVSTTLQMPLYPVAYGIGVALAIVCVVLLAAAIKHTGKATGKWN